MSLTRCTIKKKCNYLNTVLYLRLNPLPHVAEALDAYAKVPYGKIGKPGKTLGRPG